MIAVFRASRKLPDDRELLTVCSKTLKTFLKELVAEAEDR